MRGLGGGGEQRAYYLVLNRSCADLYDEIAELFADRPYIKVIVDRRRGKNGMAELQASRGPRTRRRHWRADMSVVEAQARTEGS